MSQLNLFDLDARREKMSEEDALVWMQDYVGQKTGSDKNNPLCKICGENIHPHRLAAHPNSVTCSHECSLENSKGLRRANAKAQYKRKQALAGKALAGKLGCEYIDKYGVKCTGRYYSKGLCIEHYRTSGSKIKYSKRVSKFSAQKEGLPKDAIVDSLVEEAVKIVRQQQASGYWPKNFGIARRQFTELFGDREFIFRILCLGGWARDFEKHYGISAPIFFVFLVVVTRHFFDQLAKKSEVAVDTELSVSYSEKGSAVYMIVYGDGSRYIGISSQIWGRLKQHKEEDPLAEIKKVYLMYNNLSSGEARLLERYLTFTFSKKYVLRNERNVRPPLSK